MKKLWVGMSCVIMLFSGCGLSDNQYEGTFESYAKTTTTYDLDQAFQISDDAILMVGLGCQAAEIFYPATRKFEHLSGCLIPRFHYSTVQLPDKRILFLGGERFETRKIEDIPLSERTGMHRPLDSIEVFDPKDRKFKEFGRLAQPRWGHESVALENNKILTAGGMRGDPPILESDYINRLEVFDIDTKYSDYVSARVRKQHISALASIGEKAIIFYNEGDAGKGKRKYSLKLYSPSIGEQDLHKTIVFNPIKQVGPVVGVENGFVLFGGNAAVYFDKRKMNFGAIAYHKDGVGVPVAMNGENILIADIMDWRMKKVYTTSVFKVNKNQFVSGPKLSTPTKNTSLVKFKNKIFAFETVFNYKTQVFDHTVEAYSFEANN